MSHERWTVDTPADLDHVRGIATQLRGRTDPGWQEILDAVGESPSPARRCGSSAPATSRMSWLSALQDPLRARRLPRDPSSLRSLLEQSLDDPAVRAWIVMTGTRLTGALVVTIDDCVGEIGLILEVRCERFVFGRRETFSDSADLGSANLSGHLRGPLDADEPRVVRAAGYHSEGTDEVCDRNL